MSYNGSGVFNINTAGQPVVTGTVISSTAFNALTADLATGLTTALTKDGQTTPTANIPMGGFKITGIAAATTLGDALSYGRAATVSTLTNSALTSGRVPYASTAGLLVDSANFTYDGTNLNAFTGATFASTSGRVGVGTASPSTYKFEVSTTTVGEDGAIIRNLSTASNAATILRLYAGTDTSAIVRFPSTHSTKPSELYITNVGATSPITFATQDTERMRIDSSGNVGIGTTSPVNKLQVSGAVVATGAAAAYAAGMTIIDYGSGLSNITAIGGNTSTVGTLVFQSFSSNASLGGERMRIDASGNVGIGTAAPSQLLTIVGATNPAIAIIDSTNNVQTNIYSDNTVGYVGTGSSHNFSIKTVDVVRATFDTSGNFLVGTTSAAGSRMVVDGATGGTAVITSNNTTGSGNQIGIASVLGSTANNTSSAHFQGATTGAGNWYLFGNGTTSYSSDNRLKKNIETARNGYLEDICKLRVVKYNWKNDADETPKELGLIAQEVEQIFPKLVQDDLNPISDDDSTIYKQLKQSVIPFMLLKAIQELNARLTALESK